MKRIIYVSLGNEIDDEDIDQIVEKSRNNNPQVGITGALIYHKGLFVQVLEGDEQAVDSLMGRINRDARHYDVIQLCSETIEPEQRICPNWHMALRKIGLDDYTDSLQAEKFLEWHMQAKDGEINLNLCDVLKMIRDLTTVNLDTGDFAAAS